MTNLALGLARRGHECLIALAQGPQFHDPEAYLSVYTQLIELHILKICSSTGTAKERRDELVALIRQTRPDVIIPVMLHETLGAVSVRRAAGQKVKLVYPVHDSEIWAYDAVVEYADCIDGVVSVNRLMKAAFFEFAHWPEERNFHVRCGVEPQRDATNPRFLPEALEFGFCGKLVEGQKRASDLVEFCRALDRYSQPYRLTVAGSGSSEDLLRLDLHEEVSSGRVRLLGWLSDEELYREFYSNLDVLLITSEWETGPLVAWEAMIHGVLVLTSEYRGLRCEGVLRDAENSLVFPVGDMGQAVNKICALTDEPMYLRHLAKTGQEFAQEQLGVDRMVEEWAAVLEKVRKLPDKPPRQRAHYDPPSGRMEWIEHYARAMLNRPIRHANAHAEWPRYRPGHVSLEERIRFIEQLDELEDAVSEYPNKRQNAAVDALCTHRV